MSGNPILRITAKLLLPAILLMMTAFTRIVIVLAILRQAIGAGQTPPNQVLVGLALFLTLFVMAPVIEKINAIPGTADVESSFKPTSPALDVVVNRELRDHEPMAWDFVIHFARDNHLQVELMRRHRKPGVDPSKDRLRRGIHISINGIAAGLRNTG